MARKHIRLVAGEPIEPLFKALVRVVRNVEHDDDGMAHIDCTLPAEEAAPLMRALMRVEAELLQRDAALIGTKRDARRTSEQRTHDAFAELMKRVFKAKGLLAANRPAMYRDDRAS